MAWWRRDPSLWARSPIHRYARRHLLREHDEALRNRCFSKTHPAAARHTHSTIGRPARPRRTLRSSRVEASRAGITPTIRNLLMHESLQDFPATQSVYLREGLTSRFCYPYHQQWRSVKPRLLRRGSSDG